VPFSGKAIGNRLFPELIRLVCSSVKKSYVRKETLSRRIISLSSASSIDRIAVSSPDFGKIKPPDVDNGELQFSSGHCRKILLIHVLTKRDETGSASSVLSQKVARATC
jgi:hypothetical protein